MEETPICPPESLRMGINPLDEHHLYLLDLLNKMRVEFSEPVPNLGIAEDVLSRLQQYANYHFGYEESLMEQTGCAAAAVNKIQHRLFLDRLASIKDSMTRMDSIEHTYKANLELTEFLTYWLRSHVCEVDCALKTVLDKIVSVKSSKESEVKDA